MESNKLVLRGTTSYFETVDSEVSQRMEEGGLVFLNMPLPVGCNYDCLKCFSGGSDIYNEQLRQRGVTAEFDSDLRERLVRDAFDIGARTIVIAGAGEPLIYSGLDEILGLTGRLGMSTVVFTNGFHLSKEKAESLFSNGASIFFSYDSTTPGNYDAVTQTTGNHDIVRANLEATLDLSEQYSITREEHKIVPFGVNTNPTRFTYNPETGVDEIKEISDLVFGRAAHFVSHITPSGNAEHNWELLTGRRDGNLNFQLKQAELIYGSGIGGSSRRKNGSCAYVYNGVTVYEGYYMPCPNAGLKIDFGRYPEVSLSDHLDSKKRMMMEANNPLCITRKEETSKQ
jgi:MoaA/NifB/PqqE/SkfB family radical SAM enzyme